MNETEAMEMVVGYVLINTEMKREREIYEKLIEEPKIEEAHLLAGEYDIIVKLASDDHSELGNFIIEKIRNLDGIKSTLTLAAGYTYLDRS